MKEFLFYSLDIFLALKLALPPEPEQSCSAWLPLLKRINIGEDVFINLSKEKVVVHDFIYNGA